MNQYVKSIYLSRRFLVNQWALHLLISFLHASVNLSQACIIADTFMSSFHKPIAK